MIFSSRTQRVLDVGWSVERAFDLVANVPRSAGHFPGLRGIDDLGGGVFRWRLGAIKLPGYSFDAGYTARYTFDPVAGTVTWKSVPGAGNVQEEGSWLVQAVGPSTHLRFTSTLTVDTPVPRLMERVVKKAAPGVTNRLMATYLAKIAATMDGQLT